MKIRYMIKGSLLLLLVATLTMSLKRMANPIFGKWQLNTKIEQKIQNGTVLETREKNYKPGKKSYEFLTEGKLVISDDYGKSKEKKKYHIDGMNIYIGKSKTPDNFYTCSYAENNKLVLFRTKTKTKEGKTTVETDELRLERLPQ